jgi:hypothetical protein
LLPFFFCAAKGTRCPTVRRCASIQEKIAETCGVRPADP